MMTMPEQRFEMNDKETRAAHKWIRSHREICEADMPAVSYCFRVTGIGVAVSIECHCGQTEDVTDYSAW
jgi:hypothetical protein